MVLDFEKYASKGNEFINRLQSNLGVNDRDHAARILRSTFRVIRNHLSVEESFQLIAQLPMVLKAVYVEGWKLTDHKRITNLDEFFIEIIQEEGHSSWRDFSSKNEVLDSVRAVLQTLREYVSKQEMDQALATLPRKILSELEGLSRQP